MKAANQTAADSGLVLADVELARRCARGDETALRRIFEAHEPALRRLLFRILANLEDAEELSAETFLRFWRSASRFRGECSIRAFLTRIAINLARDRMRLNLPVAESSTYLNDPESVASVGAPVPSAGPPDNQIDAIRSGLLRLSTEERELLTLYYLQDWDYGEICDVLGLGYDVLRTRLVRARKHLREIVGSEDGE